MALKLRRKARNSTGTMSLMEHLGELRTRLIVAVAAILLASIPAWFLYGWIYHFMTNPLCTFMTAHPHFAVNPKKPCDLVFTGVLEPFAIKVKVTIFAGLAIALPIVLYEAWRFVTPGLTGRERRFAIPFVLASLILFALGTLFALFTLPKALNFLLGFAGNTRVVLFQSPAKYLGFVILLILAFGISFEFPLVLVSLMAVGVLSSATLIKVWRQAVVGIALFAAIITPSQDWFTMTAMMVPLLVFYALAILIGRYILKK